MSRIHSVFRITAIAVLGYCFAANALAEGVQKLGFIDTERVYRESKQAQRIQSTLQNEFASRQKKLQKMQQEGEALEKRLAEGKIPAAEREAAMKKLAEMIQEFRLEQAKLTEDYNLRRNEEFAALQQNANRVIVDLAKREGYDLILQEAVYVTGKFDITDQVIKLLNR
ncbi:MAG: OmpH family outer membrane protein [Neisseria sp.]|uniref:OmpH family outer membrane protein n=1 Tax=Neisseria sp. TaxID=192066 RepID=UPI0026DC52E5|nr:OmpH family outer membrane protein [Neisseria sp.]MDO4640482.1 OmpH family outer membrane protein [Neisseria sp.]